MGKSEYERGSVYYISLSGYERSSVMRGHRPVVIVSNLVGNLNSDIVTVCPCTTKIKDLLVNIDIKPFIDGKPTQVLTNQLVTVPKNLLHNYSGKLDKEDMNKVETGVLISLGIVKPVVDSIQSNQEAMAQAKKDKEQLDKLLPQAKEMVFQLSDLIKRVSTFKGPKPIPSGTRPRVKRTQEEVEEFIKEWEDPGNNRNEVAEAFNFNSYSSAYAFWWSRRGGNRG